MRIEITTCHSIIAQCFDNLDQINPFSSGNVLLEELYKRKLIIHDDLVNEYFNYFQEVRPDLLDSFMSFYNIIVTQQDYSKFISSYNKINDTNNNYYDILLSISKESPDKILLSDINDVNFDQAIYNNSISKINTSRILDRDDDNLLNNYRLPIIRKVIKSNESSTKISKWLSRFIRDENNFIIVDNYLYENRNLFLHYFLKYIKIGANIEIHTMIHHPNTMHNLINTFKSPPFNKWNFKIFIIGNKRDQHARDIFTDKYYIEIDKGMKVFGQGDKTHQANITITYKDKILDNNLPPSVVAT